MSFIPTGRALLDAEKILSEIGLLPRMTYMDFGCGNVGHFVLPGARLVGNEGKVYAVDILKKALEGVDRRAVCAGLDNIVTIWGNFERPRGVPVASDSMRVISLIHLTNLLIESPFVIEEVKRLLQDRGLFLVIDWKERQKDRIISLLTAGGFQREKSFEAGPYHWGL